ncbi:cysteine--tRNA ligase [Candidatus Saccharibacteria bacterium]|nr:cysteine--tRNA ligase [Candidatus Saccharibacteria bacterium]
MKLYNTATRKLGTFKPLSDVVKIYTCGPTVYARAHIGNLTSYIYWDLLIRALRMDGYKVKRVMNFTDVGHLVSDADEGEDKMEKGAKREGKTVFEVAEHYIDLFKKDYMALELQEPDVWARATDYIAEDIEAVDAMTANGFTYETADGVYYDTSKFPEYGDFARLDLSGLKAGARIEFSNEKRNASDFAVWKFIKPGEKHEMRWDYLGRPGYPGWHLECATIIHKELGEPIDIHTGGVDHIPVHHTNEIAEMHAMTGRELAKYWVHCAFITIDGEKISKSLGNTYSLDDLSERGFSPMDYKMWVLSGHYQGTRNFTFESLEAARNRRLNWRNRIALLYQLAGPAAAVSPTVAKAPSGVPPAASPATNCFSKILDSLNNNLNSAEAFALIDNSELSLDDWRKIDELFGLRLIADSPIISEELQALVKEREETRAAKNYARADAIRDELAANGFTVKDTPNGPVWQYI